MSSFCLVLTTVAKRKDAEKIAEVLVRESLAACVQIVPGLMSYYRWKGKICREREWLLLMKTRSSKKKALEKRLHELHSYEVPEFIVLPILAASKKYLGWLLENTKE